MRMLRHEDDVVRETAAAAVGHAALMAAVGACEADSAWLEAAELLWAVAAIMPYSASPQLMRARSALARVSPETEESRSLELLLEGSRAGRGHSGGRAHGGGPLQGH